MGISALVVMLLFNFTKCADSENEDSGKQVVIDYQMVDPSLDDPEKPWCYYTHPVSCIGVPFMPDAVVVTPEGNIFTGSAELCLFLGKDARPMASRQRQFLDGFIPIVKDSWIDEDGLDYQWEAFGTSLNGFDESNTLQFIKLKVKNTNSEATEARIIAAMRHSATYEWKRENAKPFTHSTYAIVNDWLLRDEKVVCIYPTPSYWEAVRNMPYQEPFQGKNIGIEPQTEVGLAHYIKLLDPNETMELVFKLPRVSVEKGDKDYLETMKIASYSSYRNSVVDFWTSALTSKSIVHTPGEPLIEQSHRALATHVMLATRTFKNGKRSQSDGLPYPNLFLSTIYDYGQLYTNFGLDSFVTLNFPHCLDRQQPNGLFVDIAVSHGAKIHCAHGQTTSFICDFIVNTRDSDRGEEMFPFITEAVDLIREEHNTQPHGLMSPTRPYDNEMIFGQWTSHNYWTLIGLRSAIRLAKFLDKKDITAHWLQLCNDFEKTLLKAVRESAAPDGYVPTGLYDFQTGAEAVNYKGKKWEEYRTDQDWENNMLLWPTELVQPNDPLVAGTLKRLHETKFREGIMTYRNGQHLHQYITTRVINQYNANKQTRKALIDLYSTLLHMGSTGESFENMIRPWTDRDVEFCPPPHGWGCANVSNTIRNLFVMEKGGNGGIDLEKRDLMLLNVVSPAWLVNGKPLGIEKAPNSFGIVTIMMTPRKEGADVSLQSEFHTQPNKIVIRVPYFVKLNSFSSDAKESILVGGAIHLSPDATSLSMEWDLDPDVDKDAYQNLLLSYRREVGHWKGKRSEMPVAPKGFLMKEEKVHPIEVLSFELVLKAWKTEYARRFTEHINAGGKVKTYSPVPLQKSPSGGIYTQPAGLLEGKPVSCSGETEKHPASFANDGMTSDPFNYWQSTDKVAWWQVDLEEVTDIRSITVVPYYKSPGRFYQFVVKTSTDGKDWYMILDKSNNKQNFGKEGINYTGQITAVRYIRVEMLGNAGNGTQQLVEVMAK